MIKRTKTKEKPNMLAITENKSTYKTNSHKGSIKYNPVYTKDLVEMIKANTGYRISEYKEQHVRDVLREGYQRHLIRLRPQKDLVSQDTLAEYIPEIVVLNSHDTTSSFSVHVGFYRFVCENGLITGDTVSFFKGRHLNFDYEALKKYIDGLPNLIGEATETIRRMQSYSLSSNDLRLIATKGVEMRTPVRVLKSGEKENDFDYIQRVSHIASYAVRPKRYEDQQNTAWHQFNVIQENLINGFNARPLRRVKAIKSIDKTVKLNRFLWDAFSEKAYC